VFLAHTISPGSFVSDVGTASNDGFVVDRSLVRTAVATVAVGSDGLTTRMRRSPTAVA
jgi:hypothetical protein